MNIENYSQNQKKVIKRFTLLLKELKQNLESGNKIPELSIKSRSKSNLEETEQGYFTLSECIWRFKQEHIWSYKKCENACSIFC